MPSVAVSPRAESPSANPPALSAPESAQRFYADLAAIVLLGALFTLTWTLGVAATMTYGHDLFIALDAGWRTSHGQVPHADFYSPWGAAVSLLLGLAMRLAHNTPNCIAVANAIVGLAASAVAYRIGRRRLHPVAAVLFAFFVFTTGAAPSVLGEYVPSNGMFYTRWAVALLAVVLMECFAPDESTAESASYAGAACVLLFFIKLNMFLVGAGLIVLSLLFVSGRRWRGLGLGAACAALFMFLCLRFHLAGIWHDYSIILHVKEHGTTQRIMLQNAGDMLPWLLFCLLLAAAMATTAETWRARLWPAALALFVYAADVAASSTNAPFAARAALVTFFVFLAAEQLLRRGICVPRLPQVQFALPMITALLVLLSAGEFVHAHFGSLLAYWLDISVTWVRHATPSLPFDSPALAGYRVFGGPNEDNRSVNGTYLTYKVNDGLMLLRAFSSPGESINTLDFTNPFSFAMQRTPSQSGALFLQSGIDFNDLYKPAPEQVLGGADLIMVPYCPENFCSNGSMQVEAILRIYGPYLQEHYSPIGQTKQWELWRRNPR